MSFMCVCIYTVPSQHVDSVEMCVCVCVIWTAAGGSYASLFTCLRLNLWTSKTIQKCFLKFGLFVYLFVSIN